MKLRSRLLLPLLTFLALLFAPLFAFTANAAPEPDSYALSADAVAVDLAVADLGMAPTSDPRASTIELGDTQPSMVASHYAATASLYEPGPSVPLSGWRTVIMDKPLYMEGHAPFRPGN